MFVLKYFRFQYFKFQISSAPRLKFGIRNIGIWNLKY